jgi:segregation and condensation protein B
LNEEYSRENRSFHITGVAGGYQMLTRSEFFPYIQKLGKTRTADKLSQAALETLAIIAYKQPIIRADLESVRGVQCGQLIRNLLDRRLIRVVGRDARLGHPILYGTTPRFLEVFGLKSLKDLPSIEELKAF